MGCLDGGRHEVPSGHAAGRSLDDVLVELRGAERQAEQRQVVCDLGCHIIDREPITLAPPAFDGVPEAREVDHRPALRQFDRELGCLDPGPFAPHLHAVESRREQQHVERQVDGERDCLPRHEGRVETREPLRGDEVGELRRQPGVLDFGDEHLRQKEARRRMVQPGQHFKPDEGAVAHAHDRLVPRLDHGHQIIG